MDKSTLPEIYRPMMGKPSIRMPYCPICGRHQPLEQHHIVKRSAGKLFAHGHELKKPTITLCGFGNNLQDTDGKPYCHGLAHHNRLHFRWAGNPKETTCGYYEYLITKEPVKYEEALNMKGWKKL